MVPPRSVTQVYDNQRYCDLEFSQNDVGARNASLYMPHRAEQMPIWVIERGEDDVQKVAHLEPVAYDDSRTLPIASSEAVTFSSVVA